MRHCTEPVYVELKLDIFSVISADELMRVMISLGNPRTETEIKVERQQARRGVATLYTLVAGDDR